MEFAFFVLIQIVVAGSSPKSIRIDHSFVEGKEFQCSIYIQDGLQSFFQLIRRRLV